MDNPHEFSLKKYFFSYIQRVFSLDPPLYGNNNYEAYDVNGNRLKSLPDSIVGETSEPISKPNYLENPSTEYITESFRKVNAIDMSYSNYVALLNEVDRQRKEIDELKEILKTTNINLNHARDMIDQLRMKTQGLRSTHDGCFKN